MATPTPPTRCAEDNETVMRAAVVIPTHQRRDLVLDVVAALETQSAGAGSFEVAVVCDGCTDGTADALRRRPGSMPLAVIEQARSGAAVARNRGAASTSAPLLIFLDDDMIADRDLVRVHLDTHAARARAVVLGAIPVHPRSRRSFLSEGLEGWADRRHRRLASPGEIPRFDDVLSGHVSIARDTFDALGGFDTRWTAGGSFGGEDLEFGWRVLASGFEVVYASGAVAHQVYDKSFASLCRNIRHAAAADALLARVHPETVPSLVLGTIGSLPPWERRALRLTLTAPGLAAALFAPVLAFLERASERGRRGVRLEHLHAVARAHLYGRGLRDAGYAP